MLRVEADSMKNGKQITVIASASAGVLYMFSPIFMDLPQVITDLFLALILSLAVSSYMFFDHSNDFVKRELIPIISFAGSALFLCAVVVILLSKVSIVILVPLYALIVGFTYHYIRSKVDIKPSKER